MKSCTTRLAKMLPKVVEDDVLPQESIFNYPEKGAAHLPVVGVTYFFLRVHFFGSPNIYLLQRGDGIGIKISKSGDSIPERGRV